MLDKLVKEINLNKEVITNLPTNNKKQKEKVLEEINNNINIYQALKNDILKEFDTRLLPYLSLKENTYQSMKDSLAELSKALLYTNNLSSTYEKLKFDKLIYQLASTKDENLEETNVRILKIIKTFNKVGINLTVHDFNYTKFVNIYMKTFFENINNLNSDIIKETFDSLYWKHPGFLLELELNIRFLYLKNKDKIDKYFKTQLVELLSNFKKKEQSLIEDYAYLKKKLMDSQFNDKNNLLYAFVNSKLNIDDYVDSKVNPLLDSLFKKEQEEKIVIARKLLNSLREYKNYLEYTPLIEKIKSLYKEELEKNFLSIRLKKINKLESKLTKLNKKVTNSNKKTKIDAYTLDMNNLVKEIKNLYQEIDNNIFKIVIKENIKDNSTIFKALLLACQYYVPLVTYFKEQEATITYEEVDNKIKELYEYVLDPNNNLINNITITDDVDLSLIIIENYQLFNVNIEENMLSKENIDTLINNLEKIIINYQLKAFSIDENTLKEINTIKIIKSKENN